MIAKMKYFILTLPFLTISASLSAEALRGKKAFQIIENGRIIHSAVVKQSDASELNYLKRYSIIYKGQPYDCTVNKDEDGHYVICVEDSPR